MPPGDRTTTRRRRPRRTGTIARPRLSLAAVAVALALSAVAPAAADAQARALPAPAMPKTYLLQYNDQLGVPGSPAGAAVTPGGNVYTGWGELDLKVGVDKPFEAQSHTIDGGRIPIVRAFKVDQGTLYTLTVFEAGVLGNPVVMARVEVKNLLSRSNGARVTASFAHDLSELTPRARTCCIRTYRFPRPRTPTPREGLYFQPGAGFSGAFNYQLAGRGALLRDGQAVLFYPPAGGARLRQFLRTEGGAPDPNTRWGRSFYELRLPPRGVRSLDFRMPVIPVAPGTREYGAISRAPFATLRYQVRLYYNRIFRGSMGIALPERKATDTFYASLANMALSRYRSNGLWVQAVNNLRYHAFWLRDAAMMTRSFDLVGLRGIARQNLEYFFTWQNPDGLFISRPEQYDNWGQALWAFGEHYRLTRDAGFARRAFPAVQRAMSWLGSARAQDGRRLLPPVGNNVDNDLVGGHLVGDNFWAAAGIAGAVDIARGAGQRGAAASWTATLADFKATLRRQITAQTPRGPIRSSLDRPGGQYWGPLWASYISDVFPATSPVVQNTMRRARRLFSEGIMTYLYRRLLHHYSGFRVFQTDLAANRQLNALRGFYSELAHTTGTNAGWEAATSPFGDRVVDDATTPHGWWAAEYVAMLRNMLVREQGNDVYLMSAVSPSWLRPGRRITVRGAPTYFGTVSYRLTGTGGGAVLTWSSRLRAGTRLRWPVPFAARGVSARGLRAGVITLPGPRGSMSVRWSLGGPDLSYDRAFAILERAYDRSPNGATRHLRKPAPDSPEALAPLDPDQYVPPQLAAGQR